MTIKDKVTITKAKKYLKDRITYLKVNQGKISFKDVEVNLTNIDPFEKPIAYKLAVHKPEFDEYFKDKDVENIYKLFVECVEPFDTNKSRSYITSINKLYDDYKKFAEQEHSTNRTRGIEGIANRMMQMLYGIYLHSDEDTKDIDIRTWAQRKEALNANKMLNDPNEQKEPEGDDKDLKEGGINKFHPLELGLPKPKKLEGERRAGLMPHKGGFKMPKAKKLNSKDAAKDNFDVIINLLTSAKSSLEQAGALAKNLEIDGILVDNGLSVEIEGLLYQLEPLDYSNDSKENFIKEWVETEYKQYR